jgi:hypothetical protein
VLLAEHPNALTTPDDMAAFAVDYARIMSARHLASVVVTADRSFAAAIADEVLMFEPATGVFKSMSGWRRWFGKPGRVPRRNGY